MKLICTIIFALLSFVLNGQNEFHVFPDNHRKNPGKPTGNGSLNNPWDLETALSQNSKTVNGGDIIWLHEGTYHGRFVSKLESNIKGKYITVSSIPNEWAILNGNITSKRTSVLTVTGSHVIYKDFEITWLGDFSRNQTDSNFQKSDGISHNSGVNCKFINLIIHNNPGSGFGSWKRTGNSEINGCLIYNNGYFSTKRGSGVGIYVQNSSNQLKIIKNNTIFNNYYKGVEVWSANTNANEEYVKNITLQSNIIFNNGLPSRVFRDNLIIATDDRNGINIARNITVKNNIFYHNTKLSKVIENNNASSLTLGFNNNAAIESIKVLNNIIIGRKDAIRILDVKSLQFENNIVYSGYVRLRESTIKHINPNNWQFSNNTYYTRRNTPIRVQGVRDYNIEEWNKTYGLDNHTTYKNFKEFNLNNVIDISRNEYDKNRYRVVLFDKNENDVTVDFSEYGITKGTTYAIKDVENYSEVLKSGIVGNDKKIVFHMKLNKDNKNKTFDNFGVFIIEFNKVGTNEKVGFLSKFFKWIF
ncbi:MAG: right-handed parallel beta-helix repeat-containing protein [Flavobacteriaceae bacterium]